jgi:hypothetical protein
MLASVGEGSSCENLLRGTGGRDRPVPVRPRLGGARRPGSSPGDPGFPPALGRVGPEPPQPTRAG